MCEEKHQRTWEAQLVPRLQRGKCDRRKRQVKLMTSWESDQLIVLSERESRLQGEGADVIRSQQRKHLHASYEQSLTRHLLELLNGLP